MKTAEKQIIFTIGHSNPDLETSIKWLKAGGIEVKPFLKKRASAPEKTAVIVCIYYTLTWDP